MNHVRCYTLIVVYICICSEVKESRSVLDQNTSWVIVGYPRWKNFTQCSFYVFLRSRILDQETMSVVEQDNEKD